MFEFLENYRDASVPAPELNGVILTCRLVAGISITSGDLPQDASTQLRALWSRTSGGPLLVDEQFGICGLMLYSPEESRNRATDRVEAGYEISAGDWVLGEFVGDTDMLVIDADGAVLISTGSYPRDNWYWFESLSDMLSRYVAEHAEKYWERVP
ncbi:hypothetical protein [Mycolicibacterium aubagnense]|uniref:SMI1/KNR4 family protein n=1 Tax=Mycolicibacterium aubagnense TaxID=319707 RepID=A0ABN5YPI4_9MYCO|nr:hypothetical protein [Mycolicibacterium aubagnense]TLH58474.1 hypothetical protein C1S80_19805 [Mycolicibacterium aubagnense]WGI34408.1 hypothetical protein QDT91_08745 [Mycolicibacterium aubagnense]BBX83736.1 hypothetical protein MAUB_16090 [Mycolicibacterium aubagnense]